MGIIDQVISSSDEPSICSASTPRRRRYIVANIRIMAKMASAHEGGQRQKKDEERVYIRGAG